MHVLFYLNKTMHDYQEGCRQIKSISFGIKSSVTYIAILFKGLVRLEVIWTQVMWTSSREKHNDRLKHMVQLSVR